MSDVATYNEAKPIGLRTEKKNIYTQKALWYPIYTDRP